MPMNIFYFFPKKILSTITRKLLSFVYSKPYCKKRNKFLCIIAEIIIIIHQIRHGDAFDDGHELDVGLIEEAVILIDNQNFQIFGVLLWLSVVSIADETGQHDGCKDEQQASDWFEFFPLFHMIIIFSCSDEINIVVLSLPFRLVFSPFLSDDMTKVVWIHVVFQIKGWLSPVFVRTSP